MSVGVGTPIGAMFAGGATADLPCRINVNYVRWLGSQLPRVLIWFALLIAAVALTFVSQWGYLLGFIVVLVGCGYLFRTWQFFWHGCLTPAVVVSEQPLLIAAFTDLSQGVGYFPHIKIARYPTSSPTRLGQRVVTVADYVVGHSGRVWADFRPVPLENATTSAAVLAAAEAKIPAAQWQLLDDGIRSLPQPFEPGLYQVNAEALSSAALQEVVAPPTSSPTAARKVDTWTPKIIGLVSLSAAVVFFSFLRTDPYTRNIRLGDSKARVGNYAGAASDYQNAITRQPENPIGYFHRAVAYQRAAEHLKAQADFDEVIRRRPDFAPAYRMRAVTMQALRLRERADEDNAAADRLGAPAVISDPYSFELK